MAEQQIQTSTPPKPPVKNDGFNGPIPVPVGEAVPDHIHPMTLMVKGIAPDTKERLAVSLVALQHEHGDEKGQAIYNHVARLGGFFNPDAEPAGSNFQPDLQLEGMDEKLRAQIQEVLKAA